MPPLKRHPNDLWSQVKRLAPFAGAVDVARHKLAAVGDDGKLRSLLNEAIAACNRDPSEENLRLLEGASKKMRSGGSAKKARLEQELADAVHKLKLELGRVASELAPPAAKR